MGSYIPLLVSIHAPGTAWGSTGNEFFLGFLQGVRPSEVQLQLYVSTNEPNTVSFIISSALQTFIHAGTVRSDSVAVVDIPQQYQVEITELGITNQGIHIKAETDKKVSVYGILINSPGGDAYTAFPCSRIEGVQEYEYYAITYDGIGGESTVLFVGCEDNTSVTIDNSMTLTLDRLQTYLHYEGFTRRDLTGAHYVSNKPISVFSGHHTLVFLQIVHIGIPLLSRSPQQ